MGFLDDMKNKASDFVDDVKDKMDRDDDKASSDSGADGGADAGADLPGVNDTAGSTYDDSAGSMTSSTYDETAGPTSSTYDDTVGAGGTSTAGADDPDDALGDVTTSSPAGLGDTDQDRSNL